MSVALYLGLPGDGKSMAGMRKVVDWLVNTDRYVVTNLPVEIGELEDYIVSKYGKVGDCLTRVVLMRQEQVRKFWLIRGDGWRMVDISERDYGLNLFPSLQRVYRWRNESCKKRQDLESLDQDSIDTLLKSGDLEEGDLGSLNLGALYVLDEAQNFWPARSFQTTPKGLLFYLSQHRHCSDECIFVTQKEGQVEKTVRNLVLEYWVYRNLSQRRRMGFRLPGLFGYACYDQPPSTQGAQFIGCGTFKMDVKGLAQCYRTADGVGVSGPSMKADVGMRKGGLNWKWALVPLLVILGLAYFVPGWISKGIKYALTRGTDVVSNRVGKAISSPIQTNLIVITNASNAAPVRMVPAVTPDIKVLVKENKRELWTNNPSILGAFWTADGYYIHLSDGRQLGPLDYYRMRGAKGNLVGVQVRDGDAWITWTSAAPRALARGAQ